MVSGIKFEPEFKDRAERLCLERRAEHQEQSLAASVRQVATMLGMSADTLRSWTRAAEVDAGTRTGITSDMAAELRKLRRANEILKTVSAILRWSSTAHGSDL